MGAVCRAYRSHPDNLTADGRAVPQEQVAAWVGISQVQVCRIERGTNRVRDLDKLILWAQALGMPAAFAWFDIPDASEVSEADRESRSVTDDGSAEGDTMKRRTLMIGFAAGAVATPTARIGSTDVAHLEHTTAEYYRREEFNPARQLAPSLQRHIERLNDLLAGSTPAELRGRLLSVMGESLALYGWFAFDLHRYPTARRCYDLATAAAHDAGDEALTACVLGYRSYLAEAGGSPQEARDLLIAAQTHARAPSSATTRSWLAAREAELHALLHEETAALIALDRANTTYDYARPQDERAWTAFFTGSRLGSMAVTTYTRLDHPDLDSATKTVLASLGPNDTKIKSIILADLATAAIHRGAYSTGASLATRSLAGATRQEVSIGADRLRYLRRLIEPRRSVAVLADLDERLAAALT